MRLTDAQVAALPEAERQQVLMLQSMARSAAALGVLRL